MHNCMRIYMTMVHTGTGCRRGAAARRGARHKERRCPEEKPIRQRRAVAVRVYQECGVRQQ